MVDLRVDLDGLELLSATLGSITSVPRAVQPELAQLLGDRMITAIGARRASIIIDEPTAIFERAASSERSIVAEPSDPMSRTARATVEILRQGGGLMPRALVGGAFTPGTDPRLVVEVMSSGPAVSGHPSCKSQLAKLLVPGLPDELAPSVMEGLVKRVLPGGRIVVDRAAFDSVESSPMAFELAAELLAIVLATQASGGDVEDAARSAVEAWP